MKREPTEVHIQIARRSDGLIVLQVEDAVNYLTVARVEMTPEQFALAVTGMTAEGSMVENIAAERVNFLGCKRVLREVTIPVEGKPRDGVSRKDFIDHLVRLHYDEHSTHLDGYTWTLHSTGTERQQPSSKRHTYTISRYAKRGEEL